MGNGGCRRAAAMMEGMPMVWSWEYHACGSLSLNVESKKLFTKALAGVKLSIPKISLAINSTDLLEKRDTAKP
jgi:hypothetical protein